jgi:hypothetical protein
MELTKEQLEEINKKCPYDQGIFLQPYGIPVDVKELVIYGRYKTGGTEGGDCWGGKSKSFTEEPPKDRMKVLDLVLEVLCPNLSFLKFSELERLIENNTETQREYYGNSTDYMIEYLPLSELYKALGE